MSNSPFRADDIEAANSIIIQGQTITVIDGNLIVNSIISSNVYSDNYYVSDGTLLSPTGGGAGATGSTGPIGATGATGAAGSPGGAGATGSPGGLGATGATGAAGSPGSAGATGATGTAGSPGSAGPTGATGTAGSPGSAGATGATGTAGIDGATGLTGNIGATGATGLTGATGPAGPSGTGGGAGEFYTASSAPTTTTIGARWFDTINATELIYVYTPSSNVWVEMGTSNVTTAFNPVSSLTVDYLVVAGGGGGGSRIHDDRAGGGGAGGYRTGSMLINTGLTYPVVVGFGGSANSGSRGSPGGNSSFNNIVSAGGGGGGGGSEYGASVAGLSGGSGGGGNRDEGFANNAYGAGGSGNVPATTPAQGYSGGSGGGGGAGGPGSTPNGGPGAVSTITGASVVYATGGPAITGPAAADNTGDGGPGGPGAGGGAAGGSGVVIIAYNSAQRATGGIINTSPIRTVHIFTTSGDFVVYASTLVDFPANPTDQQTYSYSNITWVWNTRYWKLLYSSIEPGATGATGPQGDPGGATGATGVQGATGPQGSTGLTGATGTFTGITVRSIYSSNSQPINTVSNVTSMEFDDDSGFTVTDRGAGNVLVAMQSTFKYWHVTGSANLTATGLDHITINSGNNIVITSNAGDQPYQSIKFSTVDNPTFANVTAGAIYANAFYTANGTPFTSGGATGSGAPVQFLPWTEVTANTTLVVGSQVLVNTSSNITITLPANPSFGNQVRIVDGYGFASNHSITVNGNGANIQGVSNTLTIDVDRAAFGLVYYNVSQGWVITEK